GVGQRDVQGDHRVPESLRRARREVGPRHQRQPAHGLQPLLRRQAGGQARGVRAEEELASVGGSRSAPGFPGRSRASGGYGGPCRGPPFRMTALTFIRAVDQVSYWSGKAASWLIVALTFVVSIEVVKRYILNAPTAWSFDFTNMLSGPLVTMRRPYTRALARHVPAAFGSIAPRRHR